MPPKAIFDDDYDASLNEGFEVDLEYGQRLLHNKEREDLQRLEELRNRGLVDDEDDSVDDNETESEPDSDFGGREIDHKLVDVMNKVKNNDPSIMNKDVKFFQSDESDKVNKKDKKKKKKMYLKDVQAQQLLEEGPEYVEDDAERRIKTYAERQKELRKAVTDAVDAGGNGSDEDGDDLLRVAEKEGNDVEEVDEELSKKFDEHFGEEAEVFENQFLKNYLVKQLWKEKDVKSIDEAELEELEEDEEDVWEQVDYEINYRHEENAGEIVMGQSRKVEGSVRKVDNARKAQRKSKEERTKLAEIESKEEVKRLKNIKKEEIKKKMKKVLSVAGFKDGEECPLDANDFDDEFDPEEYDKMMKAAFDDKYYGAEDSDLNTDDDDHDEKPDFDKEDELLGLPKDWDVIQGGDGFVSARENVLKLEKNGSGDDDEEEVAELENEEEKEEEGKRKRKRKASLVQRAKEAMMEEYYKLDYEDTIGDLKTRFKYAKVQPNKYELETEEILTLDDTELNQYVPLKKMAPYVEKDWEVNKYKVKEQKHKIKELLEGKNDEMKSKKKRKKSEIEPTQKPKVEDEVDESKLSRKAKRRRRQAEKKLPPNRMAAYGKLRRGDRQLAFALDTGSSVPGDNGGGQETNGDRTGLGSTRLGRIAIAGSKQLLGKINSARKNFPMKIFLLLLGFYTANALATILGQTGDWDVLVAGIVVAAIEGIGMLMYKKPSSSSSSSTMFSGKLQSFVVFMNFWKAGVCLGLFVDAFKLGS